MKWTAITVAATLLVMSLPSFSFAAEKKITLTTYYPAPYGEYQKLTVKDGTENTGPDNPSVLHVIGPEDGDFPQQIHVSSSDDPQNRLEIGYKYDGDTDQYARLQAWGVAAGVAGAKPLMLNDAGGNVGIGMTSPQAKLDVAGGVKIGSATTCNANNAGTLRYEAGTMQFCDGSSWKTTGGAAWNNCQIIRQVANASAVCPEGQVLVAMDRANCSNSNIPGAPVDGYCYCKCCGE